MSRLLFICSRNRWRSPTAEQIFAEHPGVETASAGVSRDADTVVTAELLQWADLVFVMEPVHKTKLAASFKSQLANKKIICLNIPDRYPFMAPELVKLLHAKVDRYLDHACRFACAAHGRDYSK